MASPRHESDNELAHPFAQASFFEASSSPGDNRRNIENSGRRATGVLLLETEPFENALLAFARGCRIANRTARSATGRYRASDARPLDAGRFLRHARVRIELLVAA